MRPQRDPSTAVVSSRVPSLCLLQEGGAATPLFSEARWPAHMHLGKFLRKATLTWGECVPLVTSENTKGRKGKWKKGKLDQYPFKGLVQNGNQGRGEKREPRHVLTPQTHLPRPGNVSPPGSAVQATPGPPVPGAHGGYKRSCHVLASAGLPRGTRETVSQRYFLCKVDFLGTVGSRGRVPHSSMSRKACLVTAPGGSNHSPRCGDPPAPTC